MSNRRSGASGPVVGSHSTALFPGGALGIIAPGASTSAAVAVPDAEVGDGVVLTISAGVPPGIVPRGSIAVAGAVVVFLQNLTANPIDLGSSDLPVIVDLLS